MELGLIEIFEAVSEAKPVLFMAITGKGFTLDGARALLSNLEQELQTNSPATIDELREFIASDACVDRHGADVSIAQLANTVQPASSEPPHSPPRPLRRTPSIRRCGRRF